MNTTELKNAVESAVQSFLDNDIDLLDLKVYEPAVSHRIAFYLERDFFNNGIHVDCEYDKRLDQEKPGPNETPMRPDIVVHTRNTQENNLIAIEVKKGQVVERDIAKLQMLTQKNELYEYQLSVSVRFANNQPQYRWFIEGIETQL